MGVDWVPGDTAPHAGNALLGAAIGIAVVQILFVAARFFTRFIQRMKIGFDDYLILFALVCTNPKIANGTSATRTIKRANIHVLT